MQVLRMMRTEECIDTCGAILELFIFLFLVDK